ncbi:MAG TPA: endonuclease/exonuclease/phosphatase family protein [Ktedonobacteraceae bacterium]|nr:endonuclease/exonuclease/phosphatase family protein [Ktedonobacteraceae bacterium]
MTRILSYNILMGGYSKRDGSVTRAEQIAKIISSRNPDIVGLVEANSERVVQELAERLEMRYLMSNTPKSIMDWQVALLTRLPIIESHTHSDPAKLIKPTLEVTLEEANGQQITAFVTHLSAAFSQGWAGSGLRGREVKELLVRMSARQGTPHLIMGDFNEMAPGDLFQATNLLSYVIKLDSQRVVNKAMLEGHPHLDYVVPKQLRPMLEPILQSLPENPLFQAIFNQVAGIYAPRQDIGKLLKAGYVDCFRTRNPRAKGFSCPAAQPAGRIDYIFANPELATRLRDCDIVLEGNGIRADTASDHLPIWADFA